MTNFKNGDLGLTLGAQITPKPDVGFTQLGSFGDSEFWQRPFGSSIAGARIDAGTGNDLIGGNGDAETLVGGDGNDFIAGGGGADILLGGAGYDWLVADTRASGNGGLDANGQLVLRPGFTSANITIVSAAFTATSSPVLGFDWSVFEYVRNNSIRLDTPTNGSHSGDTSTVYLNGGSGTNILVGSAGSDILDAGAGNDWVLGSYANAWTAIKRVAITSANTGAGGRFGLKTAQKCVLRPGGRWQCKYWQSAEPFARLMIGPSGAETVSVVRNAKLSLN